MRQDVIKVSGTTAEQRAKWREAAGGGPRDLSSWLRGAADRAAARQADSGLGRREIDGLSAAITDLVAQLGRGPGNAMNQIARAMNVDITAGRKPSVASHIAALVAAADDLRSIRRQLEDVLDKLTDLRP